MVLRKEDMKRLTGSYSVHGLCTNQDSFKQASKQGGSRWSCQSIIYEDHVTTDPR